MVSFLSLHEDLHRVRINPKPSVLQSLVDFTLVQSARQQITHARLRTDGDSTGNGTGLVKEVQTAPVVAMEELDDGTEYGQHHESNGQ